MSLPRNYYRETMRLSFCQWASFLLVVVALSFLTSACSRELSQEENNRILNEKRPVPFVGHTLYMPLRVAPHFHVNAKKEVEEFSIELLWPGLEGINPRNGQEFHAPGGGRTIRIYVESLAKIPLDRRPAILQIGKAMREGLSPHESKEPRYGLEVMGAKVVRIGEVLGNSHLFDNDVLSDNNGGLLQSYLSCTPMIILEPDPAKVTGKDLVPVPHCDHYFVLEEIDAEVELHYRRVYLPEWRAIEDQTRALLRSFYTK